ncbi:MAG: 2,3-diphosphoglycerate-dependent phosphoglycerate mutase [Patescibacteria group bacterium]
MYKIVFLRHGESTWNQKGLFTGWTDVGLTARGEAEARCAGRALKQRGLAFDLAYTSWLRRATRTLRIVLNVLKEENIPIRADWRLNERHYGNLQGLSKKATAKKFGEQQVLIWRRSYDVRPPKISDHNRYNQKYAAKYRGLAVPETESLKDVVHRVLPLWQKEIVPLIKSKKRIIVAASGNSLRAIVKYLDKLSPREVVNLNIPTGIPFVYELDRRLRPIKHYYLADERTVRQALDQVKNQGKIKKEKKK